MCLWLSYMQYFIAFHDVLKVQSAKQWIKKRLMVGLAKMAFNFCVDCSSLRSARARAWCSMCFPPTFPPAWKVATFCRGFRAWARLLLQRLDGLDHAHGLVVVLVARRLLLDHLDKRAQLLGELLADLRNSATRDAGRYPTAFLRLCILSQEL